MAYLKINGVDFSAFVNKLEVNTAHTYNAQINAAGDTVVDYIAAKRTINVGIIPLSDSNMRTLKQEIDEFDISLSFMNPTTGAMEEGVSCIIPANNISYYTIQANKVSFNGCDLSFIEL